MVVQFSYELLDDFVAPKITTFTSATVPSLSDQIEQFASWMLLFGLQDALGQRLKRVPARAFRQFARRTAAAVRSYEGMRVDLLEFLRNQLIDSPKVLPYFRALDAAENCLMQCQMAFESVGQSKVVPGLSHNDLPQPINSLSNGIKHFGERTFDGRSGGVLLPVWFENDGIVGESGLCKFQELYDLLTDMIVTSRVMLGSKE